MPNWNCRFARTATIGVNTPGELISRIGERLNWRYSAGGATLET